MCGRYKLHECIDVCNIPYDCSWYHLNRGSVCGTAKATQAKATNTNLSGISGFALYQGLTISVLFTNGNSASNPTLNVDATGAKNIMVYKNGSKTRPYATWDNGTCLNLMYDGTDWVIMCNPDVYADSSSGYSVKANGWIEQYMIGDLAYVSIFQVVNFVIKMSNENYDIKLIKKDGSSPDSIMGYTMAQYNEVTIAKYILCIFYFIS